MSDTPLHERLESLPQKSMTTRLLGALDYLVPGEWTNVTSFEQMIKDVTGEDDQAVVQAVGERAIQLYNDPAQGYRRAVWVYEKLDDTGGLAGVLALANKLSEDVDFFSFLDKVTPKSETTQAVDAGVKLVGELTAFCLTNGLPGDSVGDFARALAQASKEDAIRLAAFVAVDCVLPLGPDFLAKITGAIESAADSAFAEGTRFAKIAEYLPGGGVAEKRALLSQGVTASASVLSDFVAQKGVTREGILGKVQDVLGNVEGKLDYVAAALDATTSVFEHTGVQTVARRVVTRAYGEV